MIDEKRQKELVDILSERQTKSLDWMSNNFSSQFVQVFKAYKGERDAQVKPENPAEEDPEQTSLSMPDTWAAVRRQVARGTAQIPNLRFRARDRNLSERISRTLMYQWDRGGVQRVQKRHFTQASLFGWSVRPWSWCVDQFDRTRRVNPLDPNLDPIARSQIASTYGLPPDVVADPMLWVQVVQQLLETRGRGGLLPVSYRYKAYEGPKTDFLLIADCYPEPNFQSLQTSNYFIVERRRNKEWLLNFAKTYEDAAPGVQAVLSKHPKGTPWEVQHSSEKENLRQLLLTAIDRVEHTDSQSMHDSHTHQWTVQEMWTPGRTPSVTYTVEREIFLHHMEGPDFPYVLDGKIPFTELVLIDDLLCGIGDSMARVMRGLQQLHDRQVNARFDLVFNLLRPLVGTTSDDLYENPDLIKRLKGMRLVKMDRAGELWVQPEQAAMAAVAVGLQDESGVQRMLQMLTGETNMSMSANVDPQQARTATGARIMAYQQDILTKDLVDMFNTTSLNADAEMMFLLNRSELSDSFEFDPAPYNRAYSAEGDEFKGAWIQAEPELFQIDGDIVAEIGSTLADDDEANVAKARELWMLASSRPDLFNIEKARDTVLVAMGKGREIGEWIAKPQPPPPPEMKTSLSVSAKMEMLPPNVAAAILERAQIEAPPVPPSPPPVGPPGLGGPEMGPPPLSPEEEPLLAASASLAARGRNPMGPEIAA